MLRKNKAFTLVELLVVITILSILGTIAFISLQGYSREARDATRVADLNLINKVLNLSNISNGNFPDPTNYRNITYSGSTIWKQGVFGTGTFGDLAGSISKIPLDPLTNSNYTYSLSSNGKEFQIGGISEGGDLSLIKPTYADGLTYESIIVGKYNGKASKVIVGNDTYFLAVPSLITSDIELTDYYDIISNNKLVYNHNKNLPASYTGTKVDLFGDITNYMVNSGSYVLLKKSNKDIINKNITTSDLEEVGINIDQSYEGGLLEGKGNIDLITSIDTNFDDQAGILGEDIMCNIFNICVKYKYIQWYTDVDTNCNQPDMRITLLDGTKQIWAGCNSTIGEGYEFSDGDGSQTDDCWDYNGNESDDNSCIDGVTSNKIETGYSSNYTVDPDHGYNNIWGKLYRWNELKDNCVGGDFNGTENNEKCACQKGRRLPTNDEQVALYDTIVENHRIVLENDDDSGNDGDKEKVGWKNHGIWSMQDNLSNFLKFPLTGYITSSRSYRRGYKSTILSSSEDSGNALGLMIRWDYEGVTESEGIDKDERFPVRCIKE